MVKLEDIAVGRLPAAIVDDERAGKTQIGIETENIETQADSA